MLRNVLYRPSFMCFTPVTSIIVLPDSIPLFTSLPDTALSPNHLHTVKSKTIAESKPLLTPFSWKPNIFYIRPPRPIIMHMAHQVRPIKKPNKPIIKPCGNFPASTPKASQEVFRFHQGKKPEVQCLYFLSLFLEAPVLGSDAFLVAESLCCYTVLR